MITRWLRCSASDAEIASWWPLISAPEEYIGEAAFAASLLRTADPPARTVLELGSGGGNNAFHLKSKFEMTLVDLSADMLAISKQLNPECEHLQGDMRTLRLDRTFDAVFVHDAIDYMTSEVIFARPWSPRTSTAEWVVLRSSCQTTSQRTSSRQPSTADRTHQTGAARVISNGPAIPTRATPARVPTMRFCFVRRTALRVVHDTHELGLFPRSYGSRS